MNRLLENEQITVYKYTETYVNGRLVKTLIGTFNYKGCVMPVDLSEFAPEAADRINLVVDGNSHKSYKKLYTVVKLNELDVVLWENTRYKVMRLSDYSKFVPSARHYRYVLVSMED
jgi:hypothetical protein